MTALHDSPVPVCPSCAGTGAVPDPLEPEPAIWPCSNCQGTGVQPAAAPDVTGHAVPFTTTRYRCPHCARTWAGRRAAERHIARCWRNPAAQGCKTCARFIPAYDDLRWREGDEDACGKGLRLPMAETSGRSTLAVHCPLWEANTISPEPAVVS